MEVRIKKVTTEVKTYIAFDGKQFTDRRVCEAHEKAIAMAKLKKVFDAIPKFEYEPPFDTGDSVWRWLYVKTMGDFNAIRELLFEPDASGYEYEPDEEKFPCWLLFHNDEYGMGDVDGTIGDVGAAMTDYLLKVGEKCQGIEKLLQLKEGETK